MATTEAFVTYKDNNVTLIKCKREKACDGCADQATCPEAQNECNIDTKVLNLIGAEKGDTVLLTYKSASLFKITFVVYIFPIIALILGAILGDNIAEKLNITKSGSAAIFAFIAFFAAIFVIKLYNNRVEKKGDFVAEITKIIKKNR